MAPLPQLVAGTQPAGAFVANLLYLECPNCNEVGQQEVVRTVSHLVSDEELAAIAGIDEDACYRQRERRCSKCGSRFYTTELPSAWLQSVVAAVHCRRAREVLDDVLRRQIADAARLFELRSQLIRYAALVSDIFAINYSGARVITSLPAEECAIFLSLCESALEQLSPAERSQISFRYDIPDPLGRLMESKPVPEGSIDLRRLKHPSVSQHLRALAGLMEEASCFGEVAG